MPELRRGEYCPEAEEDIAAMDNRQEQLEAGVRAEAVREWRDHSTDKRPVILHCQRGLSLSTFVPCEIPELASSSVLQETAAFGSIARYRTIHK